MIINPEKIRRLLLQTQIHELKTCPPLTGLKARENHPAAVLIPLLMDHNSWKLLLIKRTVHQEDPHSGQIAFPGGRSDSNDRSLQDTALREAAEEIGINPQIVTVLGQACPIQTVTGYEITPFVGLLPWPFSLTLSPDEVEKILLIPLTWLADSNNRKTKPWISRANPGRELPVIFFEEYEGEVLWGATAQIVVDFLALIELGD